MAEALLSLWVIYDHPRDFPDVFVARRHDVSAGQAQPSDYVMASSDLEALREAMRERGLVALARDALDDPVILEVWL